QQGGFPSTKSGPFFRTKTTPGCLRTSGVFFWTKAVTGASAKRLRNWRFRQPLGGTLFSPHLPIWKRHATSKTQVPPKVGGHPPADFREGSWSDGDFHQLFYHPPGLLLCALSEIRQESSG